jgi:hypothetical protein
MQRSRVILTAVLIVAVMGVYALMLLVRLGNALHIQSAVSGDLSIVYRDLKTYRENRGHWPASLDEAAKRPGSVLGPGHFLLDPISRRPFVYHPGAEPGSSQVLLAQPTPVEIQFWPFKFNWREGIAADGTVVDLSHVDAE